MDKFLAFTGLLLLSLSANAHDTRLVCPERIRFDSGSLSAVDLPPSATVMVTSAPQLLSGVSVFDGPPAEGAELMPVNTGKSDTTIVWRIESPSPQGVWLACNYGSQVARVVVKVEGTPARCEAQLTRGGAPRVLRATVSCTH